MNVPVRVREGLPSEECKKDYFTKGDEPGNFAGADPAVVRKLHEWHLEGFPLSFTHLSSLYNGQSSKGSGARLISGI